MGTEDPKGSLGSKDVLDPWSSRQLPLRDCSSYFFLTTRWNSHIALRPMACIALSKREKALLGFGAHRE